MQTLEALCRRLVLLYALALDLPADFFDACFAKPHMILRMSRYPVIDGEDETVASLVPHTDSGFMTLLPPNPVPGLSILLPSGRWIEAPGVEGAYVVNGGDILHRWLADLIVVGSNPLDDITHVRHLQLVLKEGRVVSDKRHPSG